MKLYKLYKTKNKKLKQVIKSTTKSFLKLNKNNKVSDKSKKIEKTKQLFLPAGFCCMLKVCKIEFRASFLFVGGLAKETCISCPSIF